MALDLLTWILAVGILLVIWLVYAAYTHVAYKGPPHVIGLPLVGYVPFLGKEPHITLQKLSEKYGPVFSFNFGTTRAVVLSSYEAVHEAFVKKVNNFSDRPENLVMKVYPYETAFIYLNGDEWKATRNFTLNSLKMLGFGKTSMESSLQHDVNIFMQVVKEHVGIPFDIESSLAQLIGHSILRIITGDVSSSWKDDVIHRADQLAQSYGYDATVLFPWLTKVPVVAKLSERRSIRQMKQNYWKLLDSEIEKQRKEFAANPSEPQSFIQHWCVEQTKREKDNNVHKSLFSNFGLKNNLDILVQASVDTTSVTLLWSFLFLTYYEDIQREIHSEIDRTIGEYREPNLKDLKDMNYTKAFMQESHRKSSVLSLGVFHRNKTSDTVLGFEIPEDTLILGNLWSVHHDEKLFPNPFKLDPNRFLDANGKFIPCSQVVPFSIGGRICPGKAIAEMQMFLVLVTVLQTYRLRPPEGFTRNLEISDLDKAFIRRPAPFAIVFEQRHP